MIYLSTLTASPDDDRDYPYVPLAVGLPPAIDMRRYAGPVEDQGQLGSCTANATVSACETILQRGHRFTDLSRLFNYYCSREADGGLAAEGADLRTAIKMARNLGLPPEAVWPYTEASENVKPHDVAYSLALTRKVGRFERIDMSGGWQASAAAICSAVAEGCPVVIALRLSSEFYDISGALIGQQYSGMQKPGATFIGNHAVVIEGYLPGQFAPFIVENSWGDEWGDAGYFALRQDVLGDVFEAWVIRSFAGLDSDCRTQFLTNQDACRAWVSQHLEASPQLVIDTCVDFEVVPAELEWLMLWELGAVLAYSKGDGKSLDWDKFI